MEFIDIKQRLSACSTRMRRSSRARLPRPGGLRNVFGLLLVVAGLFALPCPAQAEEIYILSSRVEGAHAALASELRKRLQGSLPPRFVVYEVSLAQVKSIALKAGRNDYIVTIGTRALSELVGQPIQASLIATLLPKKAYDSILQHNPSPARVSAVYIDQPAARNIDLVGVALPNKSIGVLLSDASNELYRNLENIRRRKGIKLNLRVMASNDNLTDALDKVLRDSDVLLAFADPVVSNRNTAQHLLLTTYRRGIPMVAYSRAYVRAGALMAVYSTPEQYAHQVAEMVISSIRNGSVIPSPQFPKYFSVEINRNVAYSLGLDLPSQKTIENRLMAARQVPGE